MNFQATNTFDRHIEPDMTSAIAAVEQLGIAHRAWTGSSSAFKSMRYKKLIKTMEKFSKMELQNTPEAFAFNLGTTILVGIHYNLKTGVRDFIQMGQEHMKMAMGEMGEARASAVHAPNVDDVICGLDFLMKMVPAAVTAANKHWRENGGKVD